MKRKRRKIIHQVVRPVTKHDGSTEHDRKPESGAIPTIEVHSAPDHYTKPTQTEKKPQMWLEAIWKVIPIALSVIALFVSTDSRDASRESAKAAQRNADTAKAAFDAAVERDRRDQRAWIGVVGPTAPPLRVGEK